MKQIIFFTYIFISISTFAANSSSSQFIHKGANSKVTVVEFADFQCPYCLRSATQVIPQLITKYGDSISIVFHNLPLDFHPQARAAAIAGVCANNQSQFPKMYNYLYANQAHLGSSLYMKAASDLGLNVSEFTICLASKEAAARVEADIELSRELKVFGTPGFFLVTTDKTVRMNGSYPLAEVQAQIDLLLKP